MCGEGRHNVKGALEDLHATNQDTEGQKRSGKQAEFWRNSLERLLQESRSETA